MPDTPDNRTGEQLDAFASMRGDSAPDVHQDSLPGTEAEEGVERQFGREMGFFDHLEELRGRIIKSLLALAVTSIICGVFLNFLMEKILMGPANRMTPPLKMQNFVPMGQITIAIQVVLISGVILAIPVIIWQFWQFVKPGLYVHERKMALWVAVATIFCFLSGVAFAYFIMIPTSLSFTSDFQFAGIENHFAISEYFSFILGFILATGAVFEMPMLSYALSRFGILKPNFLGKYRRHSAIIILIVAAIITPTPDPFNQLLLALPLYGLFEISILVAKFGGRQRAQAEQES